MNRKPSSEIPTTDHTPVDSPNVAPESPTTQPPPQIPGDESPQVDALGGRFENDWRLNKQSPA